MQNIRPQLKDKKENNSGWFHVDNLENVSLNDKISHQLKYSLDHNSIELLSIDHDICLLSIPHHAVQNASEVKSIVNEVHLSLLPKHFEHHNFHKLSYKNLRNLLFNDEVGSWYTQTPDQNPWSYHIQIYVFFSPETIADFFIRHCMTDSDTGIISSRNDEELILHQNQWQYKVDTKMLAAKVIWQSQSLDQVCAEEWAKAKRAFAEYPHLYQDLRRAFPKSRWIFDDSGLWTTYRGLLCKIDYQKVYDRTSKLKNLSPYFFSLPLCEWMSNGFFPTITVRSPNYLKARPGNLHAVKPGYVLSAQVENHGRQKPISCSLKNATDRFRVLSSEALGFLGRLRFQARVIAHKKNSFSVLSLVGDQIASIAAFPHLIQGVFEELKLPLQKQVRIIAHNQNIITIANLKASLQEIQDISQKAGLLFQLIAPDGTDPLALCEEVELPAIGAGNFCLRTVPDQFFELWECAQNNALALPKGHGEYLRGLAFETIHEWGLAVHEFRKAVFLDKNDGDINFALGRSLIESGYKQEALPFLKKASLLIPKDTEITTHLGLTYLALGHIPDAIEAFEKTVQICPADIQFLSNLGRGYFLGERLLEAEAVCEKAIRYEPECVDAHVTMAHIHLRQGNFEKAIKHALMAYQCDPQNKEAEELLSVLEDCRSKSP